MSIVIAPGVRVHHRYQIVERLPDFGIGETWRARDTDRHNQLVAVKFLRPRRGDDRELPEALERHLVMLRALQHGNVLRTLDHGLFGDRPFVVHAHFAGTSLASGLPKALGDPPFPPDLVERLHDRVLAALVAAHAARVPVFHGSIDARSVLVLRAGPQNFELRVLDFGLAPHADWHSGERDYRTLATRRAPEATHGAPPSVAKDVFEVGELTRVLFGRLPEFDLPGEGVPPATWDAVRKATAKAPGERYPTLDAFAVDFQRLWRTPQADVARACDAAPEASALDVDATVLVRRDPKPRPAAGKVPPPPPPPVAQFPAHVLARRVDPYEDATVQVMPPLARPAEAPLKEETTVRVQRMAQQRSPWDVAGQTYEATVVAPSPLRSPSSDPRPLGTRSDAAPRVPTAWDTEVRLREAPVAVKKPTEPAPKSLEEDRLGKELREEERRAEHRMRAMLAVIAAVVLGLAGTLVALLARG